MDDTNLKRVDEMSIVFLLEVPTLSPTNTVHTHSWVSDCLLYRTRHTEYKLFNYGDQHFVVYYKSKVRGKESIYQWLKMVVGIMRD
jgi:hypothetical protein